MMGDNSTKNESKETIEKIFNLMGDEVTEKTFRIYRTIYNLIEEYVEKKHPGELPEEIKEIGF